MRRPDFDHVIAAAANVTGEDEFVVIGSQGILGSFPSPPDELLHSMEVDMYPLRRPELADAIDGALGDGSAFEQQFGYFAHGVGPETAQAPDGWKHRLVAVQIPPRLKSPRTPVAFCIEPHDLVLAKLPRGSQRDWDYARAAVKGELVSLDELIKRSAKLPLDGDRRTAIATMLGTLRSERAS